MINGNYKNGIAIMLEMNLLKKLFEQGSFTNLKQLKQGFDMLCHLYKKKIPTLIFSTNRNYKVTNEDLTNISALIGTVITYTMSAHSSELNQGGKRKNVIDSLVLAEEHLTKLREIINEAKTK